MKEEKTFGEKIKHLRVTLGLTQEQFALACGLTQKMISKYETDTEIPSLESFAKIIKSFHINSNLFFKV